MNRSHIVSDAYKLLMLLTVLAYLPHYVLEVGSWSLVASTYSTVRGVNNSGKKRCKDTE